MYVKDYMTREPYTVTGDTVLSKAIDIMRKHNFHRVPVVDADGKLEGLITGGMVEESSGNTSLSIYELNYLFSRTKVSDMMIRDVKTTTADVLVEEAAQKMLDNGIAVLPVVDEENRVIGIITDRDIFQALVTLLGYKHQGTRFIISCDDHPGFMVGVAKAFADNDANLEALAVYHTEERGTELAVKATGAIPVDDMTKILLKEGYRVTDVVQTTQDGEVVRYPVSE